MTVIGWLVGLLNGRSGWYGKLALTGLFADSKT